MRHLKLHLLLFVAAALAVLTPALALAQDGGQPLPLPTSPVAPAPAQSPLLGLFFEYALPPLLTGLGGLVLWLLGKLGTFLAAKTSAQVQGSRAAKGLDALSKLTAIVQHTVTEAEVSLRPLFSKSLEDGRLTPEEGAALKAAVLKQLKEQLAPELLALVKTELGDAFETVLGGLVEGAVAKLGTSSAPAAATSAALALKAAELMPAPPSMPLAGS
jgi:hypothetical protein